MEMVQQFLSVLDVVVRTPLASAYYLNSYMPTERPMIESGPDKFTKTFLLILSTTSTPAVPVPSP